MVQKELDCFGMYTYNDCHLFLIDTGDTEAIKPPYNHKHKLISI